jgi:DNA-binding cell septation regulator SpoVG
MSEQHTPAIVRVTPFPQNPDHNGKGALASVTMLYGPIVIRARLCQGERGMFLSMPSRKSEQTNTWWESVSIQDRLLFAQFEQMAVHRYEEQQQELLQAV